LTDENQLPRGEARRFRRRWRRERCAGFRALEYWASDAGVPVTMREALDALHDQLLLKRAEQIPTDGVLK
jgi:hypothetical protein